MAEQDSLPALQRADRIVASVPVISEEIQNGITGSTSFQTLGDVPDIDGGEQLLSAILLEDNADILVSGDKRFLRALCGRLGSGWQSYCERIIICETTLILIEESYGFDYILSRCFAARSCDESLRLSFGRQPNRDNFVGGLRSFGRIDLLEGSILITLH